MIYGISLLLLVLSLVLVVPAVRKMAYMRSIRKNSGTTTGRVVSTKSAMNTGGWLLGEVTAIEFVNKTRPLVSYQSPKGHEMMLDVIPSNFLSKQKYVLGEAVEVAYDLTEPGRAYLVREWKAVIREISIGTAAFIAGVVLWIVGRVYDLPF